MEERVRHNEVDVATLPITIAPAVKLQLHQAEVECVLAHAKSQILKLTLAHSNSSSNLLGLLHLYPNDPAEKNALLASQLFSRSSFLMQNEVSYLLHRALALWDMNDLITAIPIAISARKLAIQQFPRSGGVFLGRILGSLYCCHAEKRLQANKFREVLDAIEKSSEVAPLKYDALWAR